MANRPVSPHEKSFMERQGGGRFNVTAANMPKRRKNNGVGYKSVTTRLMEASGRRSYQPGQRRPSPAPAR